MGWLLLLHLSISDAYEIDLLCLVVNGKMMFLIQFRIIKVMSANDDYLFVIAYINNLDLYPWSFCQRSDSNFLINVVNYCYITYRSSFHYHKTSFLVKLSFPYKTHSLNKHYSYVDYKNIFLIKACTNVNDGYIYNLLPLMHWSIERIIKYLTCNLI